MVCSFWAVFFTMWNENHVKWQIFYHVKMTDFFYHVKWNFWLKWLENLLPTTASGTAQQSSSVCSIFQSFISLWEKIGHRNKISVESCAEQNISITTCPKKRASAQILIKQYVRWHCIMAVCKSLETMPGKILVLFLDWLQPKFALPTLQPNSSQINAKFESHLVAR